MRGTLVLSILSIRSSYALQTETTIQSGSDVPDTLQWWIGTDQVWRVKTYAIDHDIHTHSVAMIPDMVKFAITNNAKHYGDVIASSHVLDFNDCADPREVEEVFRRTGVEPRLELAPGRFAFWKPDDAKYSSKTEPT
jgi:hypothetical protein